MGQVDIVRQQVLEYLETPQSYPLVLPMKDEKVQDQLNRQHALRERRKFTDEPATGHGELI